MEPCSGCGDTENTSKMQLACDRYAVICNDKRRSGHGSSPNKTCVAKFFSTHYYCPACGEYSKVESHYDKQHYPHPALCKTCRGMYDLGKAAKSAPEITNDEPLEEYGIDESWFTYIKIGLIENFLSKKYDVKRRAEIGSVTLYVTEKHYDRTQKLLSNVVANLPIIKGEKEAVFVATALRYVANKLAPESAKDNSGVEFVDQMEGWLDRAPQDNSGEYDGKT